MPDLAGMIKAGNAKLHFPAGVFEQYVLQLVSVPDETLLIQIRNQHFAQETEWGQFCIGLSSLVGAGMAIPGVDAGLLNSLVLNLYKNTTTPAEQFRFFSVCRICLLNAAVTEARYLIGQTNKTVGSWWFPDPDPNTDPTNRSTSLHRYSQLIQANVLGLMDSQELLASDYIDKHCLTFKFLISLLHERDENGAGYHLPLDKSSSAVPGPQRRLGWWRRKIIQPATGYAYPAFWKGGWKLTAWLRGITYTLPVVAVLLSFILLKYTSLLDPPLTGQRTAQILKSEIDQMPIQTKKLVERIKLLINTKADDPPEKN